MIRSNPRSGWTGLALAGSVIAGYGGGYLAPWFSKALDAPMSDTYVLVAGALCCAGGLFIVCVARWRLRRLGVANSLEGA